MTMSTRIDKAAIGLSLACAVHCLLLPVAVVMLPTLAATTLADEQFHQWMLVAVLPTSLIALFMGCRQHGNTRVVAVGLLGLAILILAVYLGHGVLGETGELIASLLGASVIAFAHLRNHALCKRLGCHCETP